MTTTVLNCPPYVLNSARVLVYATVDVAVSYTGRIEVYVGGERLPPVPHLAICENLSHEGDFLLCYCTEGWEVLGVAGYDSLDVAKQRAEVAYAGISKKWQAYRPLSARELAYVEQVRAFVQSDSSTGPYPEPPNVP
jgi:hypothetical protein